jgi:asparagine synthase (glutamine-hydrolysing)
LYGDHNVDWHARMAPRLGELSGQIEALADHPELGPLIDMDAMRAELANWPDSTPTDPVAAARLRFFLPAMLYVAKYVDAMTGRNRMEMTPALPAERP